MDFEELKRVLFQEVTGNKYNRELLINVYVKDAIFVKKLVKEGKCSAEAVEFLKDNIQKIADIFNQISIPYFRNTKYEELLLDYYEKKVCQQVQVDQTNTLMAINNHSEKSNSQIGGRLVKDWNINVQTYMKYLIDETKNGRIVWVESKSGKSFTVTLADNRVIKLRYSVHKGNINYSLVRMLNGKKNKVAISEEEFKKLYSTIKNEEFVTSLKSAESSARTVEKKKTEVIYVREDDAFPKCNIYAGLVPISSSSKKKQNQNLKIRERTVYNLQMNDEKYGCLIKRTYIGKLKWKCVKKSKLQDRVYISEDDKGNKLLLHCYSDENAFLYRFYINGENQTIGGIQRYLEQMIVRKNPKVVSNVDLSGYYVFGETKTASKEEMDEPNNFPAKRRINVVIKDLVVRRNVFKCMHKKHAIEDIDAVVKIMNKNIEIEEVVVSAGYCRQCKVFFILESTYQYLRKKGVVAFRTVDEKSYLNQNYLNGKLLAQESILMQFGYTVSQTEGLSEERRHKILSVLVDNHILTKSEIISYLDFFISQRKSDKFSVIDLLK